MTNDPFNLLDRPASTRSTSQPSGGLGWLIVGLLLGLACVALYQRYQQATPDGDRQEQVEPVNAKGSWVFVVEETGDRAKFPHLATVQNDLDFWESLRQRGIEWTFYDADAPEIASYLPDAKAAGLPALLVVSPGGKVLSAKSLPATTDAIGEVINEVFK